MRLASNVVLYKSARSVRRETQLPERAFKKGGVNGKSLLFQSNRPFAPVVCNQFSLDCFTNCRRFFPIMPHSRLRRRQMHRKIDNLVPAVFFCGWTAGRPPSDSLKRKAAAAVFRTVFCCSVSSNLKGSQPRGWWGWWWGWWSAGRETLQQFLGEKHSLHRHSDGLRKEKCGKGADSSSVLPAEADLGSVKAPEEVITFAVALPSCVPAWYFADVSILKATTGWCSGSSLQFQQAWLDYWNSTFQTGQALQAASREAEEAARYDAHPRCNRRVHAFLLLDGLH